MRPTRSHRTTAPLAILLLLGAVLVTMAFLGLVKRLDLAASQKAETILFLGLDQPQHGKSRADAILLVRVHLQPTRHVTVLSLPRDTGVAIPGFPGERKLNSAYTLGGVALTIQTLQKNFGVTPTHTVVLQRKGLAEAISALGGIELNVPQAMDYADKAQGLHIHLKPGVQCLQGTEAVSYLQFGRGDKRRMARQQAFVQVALQQALTPQKLTRLPRIAPLICRAVQTDLSAAQLVSLATQLRGLRSQEYHALTLPGHSEKREGVSYFTTLMPSVEPLLNTKQAPLAQFADIYLP